jgi:lipopolysaccharide transport system ATP-binding protein
MSNNIAIRVQNLSKCYHLYEAPRDRLKQFILPGLRRMAGKAEKQYFREFWALKDVSFEVKKGEVLGIVGRNGAGKSTLLQILCGTLTPTAGTVETNGRIAALLELGAGFNPEFTGRENVFMSAAIMGLSQEEIAARFEDIVEFSGIRDFIDQPVKTYSSGMYVRLAFSIAISVDPDILIVDEALSVGDGEFSRKSFDRIMALKEQNKTILFCSHSLYQVEALCNRAVWLNHGAIAAEGMPAEVVIAYDASQSGKHHHNEAQAPLAEMPAQVKGTARISRVEASTDGASGKLLQIDSGHGNLAVNVAFSSDPSLPAPSVAICIAGSDGRIVTSAGTHNDGLALERDSDGNGGVSLRFDSLPLLKGCYDIHVYLMCERAIHVYDIANMVAELNVTQRSLELGVISIPHGWEQWVTR